MAMSQKKIQDLIGFTEEKIAYYVNTMKEQWDILDRLCMGRLNFYLSLRNVIKDYEKHGLDRSSLSIVEMFNAPSYRDFGMIEAVNDTAVFLGLFNPTAKFFHIADANNAGAQEKDVTTRDLLAFIEEKINFYATSIPENQDRADRAALGQLNFYISLRNVVKLYQRYTVEGISLDPEKILDDPSYRDFGLIEAVHDTLVHLGLFKPSEGQARFYHVTVA